MVRVSSLGRTLANFPKLKAFPFGLSPADAVVQMAPYASLLLVGKQLIGSLAARFLPGLGFEPLKPTRIAPVYFPAWIVDAELQASVSYGNEQVGLYEFHETRILNFAVAYDHVPISQHASPTGSDFRVLSLASFWYKQLRQHQIVPFTSDLEVQFDTEVCCLPYTISPFAVVDLAKSWPHGDVNVEEDFRLSPTSVKPNLIAAFPVLIPIYLAQYTVDLPDSDDTSNFTLFMEGFGKQGRIFSERFGAEAGAKLREIVPNPSTSFIKFTHLLDGTNVQLLRGNSSPFTRTAKLVTPGGRTLNEPLKKWLDDKLANTTTTATLLAELSRESAVLRGEDVRVRNFMDPSDRSNVHMWLSLGTKLASTESVIEAMKSAKHTRQFHLDNPSNGNPKEIQPADIMKSALLALETSRDEVLKKRQETVPTWWKEWENPSLNDESMETETEPPAKDQEQESS
ncbi:hypothetical protein AX17_002287 [Amanita inopinata Kibby_2008]|nr:hypothetical protein AX17_002287 [Amanita inopinata Kibby_2008]